MHRDSLSDKERRQSWLYAGENVELVIMEGGEEEREEWGSSWNKVSSN